MLTSANRKFVHFFFSQEEGQCGIDVAARGLESRNAASDRHVTYTQQQPLT